MPKSKRCATKPPQLAVAAARKLAHAALAALPAGDVEAALREAMHQAIGEPRITLSAAPDVIAALQDRIDAIAHEEGYEGRVLIAADPALARRRLPHRMARRRQRTQRSRHRQPRLDALIARRFSQSDDSATLKG